MAILQFYCSMIAKCCTCSCSYEAHFREILCWLLCGKCQFGSLISQGLCVWISNVPLRTTHKSILKSIQKGLNALEYFQRKGLVYLVRALQSNMVPKRCSSGLEPGIKSRVANGSRPLDFLLSFWVFRLKFGVGHKSIDAGFISPCLSRAPGAASGGGRGSLGAKN